MAKVGTLVTFPNYYRGQKALITASLSGAQYDLEIVKEADATSQGAHYGSKQGKIETLNHTLSHERGSERSERASE